MFQPLPSQVIESIARMDAKRPVDGIDNMHTYIVDLLPQILNSADKKMVPLMSKLSAAYHPLRYVCMYECVCMYVCMCMLRYLYLYLV